MNVSLTTPLSLPRLTEPILQSNVEIVGQNLTPITVALLPIFSQFTCASDSASSKQYKKDSITEAVALFQYLVSGQLGTMLKPYLASLPFLPNHDAFEPVKSSLRKLSIDLDAISKYSRKSTQGSEEYDDNDESTDDEGKSNPLAVVNPEGRFLVVLQRRLKNLGSLISHENINVRRTVLHQLASLVKENKRLFKKLIDSEQSASTRFLTVVSHQSSKDASDSSSVGATSPSPAANSSGGVSVLIQALLDRCAKETDEDVKLALAQTLGEIGAIDPNKLSMEKTDRSNQTDASTDQNSDIHWRLSQPPWKSSMDSYSLRLLSNRLVVALKAALTTQDQDKVGFAIQETLKLLSGKPTSPSSQGAQKTPSQPATEIDPDLKEKLMKCDVFTVVEPFLSTQFKQSSLKHGSSPPFFNKDKPYKRWISSWSRYLIEKSCQNELSRWKTMFHALNSAVRADVGLSVAEFLLPLLILDVACFGGDNDLEEIINEIRLVFDASSPNSNVGDLWSVVCADDHRRAVNTVFTVLETLEYWTETEIEKRYVSLKKGSSRRSPASSASSLNADTLSSGGNNSWPVDEGIERIQNISSQITLQMRADAAIKVGAHARALKYLELDARKNVVKLVYNADEDEASAQEFSKAKRIGNTLAPIPAKNLEKVQVLLGKLDDVDSMSSMSMYNASSSYEGSLVEQIYEKEVIGDWAGALQGYEQAIILHEAEAGGEMGDGADAMDVANDDDDDDITVDNVDDCRESGIERKRSKQLLEKGLLRSLLHLGQLESVLNQVGGMMNRKEEENEMDDSAGGKHYSVKEYLPNAVEAAWRLQKWPLLTELLEKQDQIEEDNRNETPSTSMKVKVVEDGMDVESKFQIGVGRAMLGLHEKKKEIVKIALDKTRIGLMEDMSNVARESYSRSLNLLLKFHCLQEIEQSTEILCKKDKTDFLRFSQGCSEDGWDWDGRLANLGRGDSDGVITVRLALAKLANAKALEGDLWLTTAKKARKSHNLHIAEPALSRALAAYKIAGDKWDGSKSKARLQIAKVKQDQKRTSEALMIIEPNNVDKILSTKANEKELQDAEVEYYHGRPEEFQNMALYATRWMVESNLKFGNEIIFRFKNILKIAKHSEKSNFYYARYLDGLVEARVASMLAGDFDARSSKGQALKEELDECSNEEDKRVAVIKHEQDIHRYIFSAVKYYGKALTYGDKHFYQALPRMLTMWFEFTAIPVDYLPEETQSSRGSRGRKAVSYSSKKKQTTLTERDDRYKTEADSFVRPIIDKINKEVMSENRNQIPRHVFYSALPQLISRIAHPHKVTQRITVDILKKVLVAYPKQAMWGLAWLKHSHSKTRKDHGDDIFRLAADELMKTDKGGADLLKESTQLFKLLKSIADNDKVSQGMRFEMPRPRFKNNITLQDFVPPVQAALSMNVAQRMNRAEREKRQKGVIAEVFPQYVPRIESFSRYGRVFNTKAKPKQITAFAVGMRREGQGREGRIGEIHFLVKKENKGDLRKDARVQDLNNVLNRLLVSGGKKGKNGGRGGQRRLQLRTYSVTCLSEDTGIMEWVPNTNSLRNVIGACVNSQVEADNPKRRGGRVTEFGRKSLRDTFAHCQDLYINHGKLSSAAIEFER